MTKVFLISILYGFLFFIHLYWYFSTSLTSWTNYFIHFRKAYFCFVFLFFLSFHSQKLNIKINFPSVQHLYFRHRYFPGLTPIFFFIILRISRQDIADKYPHFIPQCPMSSYQINLSFNSCDSRHPSGSPVPGYTQDHRIWRRVTSIRPFWDFEWIKPGTGRVGRSSFTPHWTYFGSHLVTRRRKLNFGFYGMNRWKNLYNTSWHIWDRYENKKKPKNQMHEE